MRTGGRWKMTDQEFILWASKAAQSYDPKRHDRVQVKEPTTPDLHEDHILERTARFTAVPFNRRLGLYFWELREIEFNSLPIPTAGEGAKQ